MASQEKVKAILGDLGKPTLRGVRKCPKCGTYNGTRGISCKNKSCGTVFKERDKRKGHSSESVRITTGSTAQVFSVRLRDRGPDYRGFVQLPDINGNTSDIIDQSLLIYNSRCFVDSCSKLRQNKIHLDSSTTTCVHIKSAVESPSEETISLTLKNSVLNSTLLSPDLRQEIWLLATDTTGPLVQRVTKNVFVVKCKPTPFNPLGFLHFLFYEMSRNRTHPEYKYLCSCKAFKTYKPPVGKEGTCSLKRCIHFYACVCAFASDEKLMEEFSHYINITDNVIDEADLTDEAHLLTVDDVTDPSSLEVFVMDEAFLEAATAVPSKRSKQDDALAEVNKVLLAIQEQQSVPINKKAANPKLQQLTCSAKPTGGAKQVDEDTTLVTFHQWLANVTERINQTMHYQFDGCPDPLVFHAPQEFFDCLQQRIAAGSRKKRLPNSTTAFVRKDALPLGTFTKYTWQLTSLVHVKQIFDTPAMPLEVLRNFVQNRDSTYDVYEFPQLETENLGENGKQITPIRPFELKTFLKVGIINQNQKEPIPFTVEWIPDILPKSHIGELRIKFQYGHQRNGTPELRHIQDANNISASYPMTSIPS